MKRAARIAGLICFFISSLTLAAIVTTGGGNVQGWEPVRTSYVAGQFGAALENEATSDVGTVMYCDISNPDGTTSKPECAISGVKHQGVGPFSPSSYLSMDENTMRYAGDFRTCYIVEAVSLAAAAQLFVATDVGASGYGVILKTNGAVEFSTFAAGPTSTVSTSAASGIVVGQKNLICYGRNGTDQILSVNGVNTTTANTKTVTPTDIVYIGTDYAFANTGSFKLYEMATSAVAATTAYFDSVWTAATTCRSAGRCLPTMTGEQIYLTGEEFLAGQSPWCGDAGACAAAKSFSVGGQPLPAKSRYNWPALAWSMTGTVPRVTATAVMDRGFGPKQEYITGFDGANNRMSKVIATSPSTFTQCLRSRGVQSARFVGDAGTSLDTILSHTTGTTGWLLTSAQNTDSSDVRLPFVFSWYDSGGTLRSASSTSLNRQADVSVCFGHDGTNGWITVDDDTPVSAAFSYGPPANGTSMVYGGTTLGTAYISEFKELMISTTAPTSALLKWLASAPCTAPGNCFPTIANETMRCNARRYQDGGLNCETGGIWTTTGTLIKGSSVAVKTTENRDANAAGPLSDANYFMLGTGADVLDFAGDFSCCVVASPLTLVNAPMLFSNGLFSDSGYYIRVGTNGAAVFTDNAVATAKDAVTSAGAVVVGAENLVCAGRGGGLNRISANNGIYGTIAGFNPPAAGVTFPARLSRYQTDNFALSGTISELWCSTTPASDALFTKIQRRFLGQTGTQDQPITVTRTTTLDVVKRGGSVTFGVPGTPRFLSPSRYQARVGTALTAGLMQRDHQINPGGYLITGVTTNMVGSYWADLADLGTGIGLSKTVNGALAPDGTMTATALRETAVPNNRFVMTRVNSQGAASLYVKPTANRQVVGVMVSNTFLSVYGRLYHYPSDAMYTNANGGPTIYNYGHEHLDDGWIRMWFNATDQLDFAFLSTKNDGTTTASVAGDINEGMDVWGMQQYGLAADVTYYPPPLCGGASATVGTYTCNADVVTVANPLRPNGADWTNLILQSEDLATTWTNSATTETVNAVIAPDGSFTADLLAEDAANSEHYLTQAYTATAAPWTCSVYAKQGTRHHVEISTEAGTTGNYFDLTTCSVGTAVGAGVTAVATTEANGWCRVAVTHTMGAGATSVRAYLADADNSNSYAGTTGLGLYLWGWQCEAASSPSPYCPTTTAARTCGPGATGKVTVNAALQNTTLANAAWTKAATVTVADADATCPVDEKGNRGTLVTSGTDGNGVAQDVALTTTRSVYLSFPSGGAACDVTWGDFDKTGAADLTLSATPVRFAAYTAGNTGINVYRKAGGCGSWCQSSTQLEAIATGAGYYCGPTGAAAKTCTPSQKWCVRVKDATPLGGRDWSATAAYLWSSGVNGAVNTTALRAHTDGKLYLDSYDAAGVLSQLSYTHSFAAGSTHTLTACNFDGTLSLTVDGMTVTPTGTTLPGTSVRALYSATIGVGQKGDGTLLWNGTIGGIDFNSTGRPQDFAP